jgi:hypothetical protein
LISARQKEARGCGERGTEERLVFRVVWCAAVVARARGCAAVRRTQLHLNHGSMTQLITVASVIRMTERLCGGRTAAGGGPQQHPIAFAEVSRGTGSLQRSGGGRTCGLLLPPKAGRSRRGAPVSRRAPRSSLAAHTSARPCSRAWRRARSPASRRSRARSTRRHPARRWPRKTRRSTRSSHRRPYVAVLGGKPPLPAQCKAAAAAAGRRGTAPCKSSPRAQGDVLPIKRHL